VSVRVSGQVDDLPAVETIARVDEPQVAHELNGFGEKVVVSCHYLDVGGRHALGKQMARRAFAPLRVPPGSQAVLVVEASLGYRRPRQFRHDRRSPDVIRMEMGDEDLVDRLAEHRKHSGPPLADAGEAECGVDQDPSTGLARDEVAMDMVDPKRDWERQAPDAVGKLEHALILAVVI
jgi:hypothetical protein